MTQEAQQGEPSTWWLRRLAGYLVPHRRKLITAFAAAMVVMATTALLPLIIRSTVDRAVVERRDSLAMWLTLLVGVGLVRTVFAGLRRYTASLIGYEVEFDFRRQIFDHLQHLDFARHDQLETGQLVSRTNGDLALLYELLILTPLMTSNLILFLVSIGIMLALSPLLALVMALTFPALLFGAVRMSKVIYPSSWDALQWSGEVAGVVEESVSGVRVVKGFGQERRQLDRLVGAADAPVRVPHAQRSDDGPVRPRPQPDPRPRPGRHPRPRRLAGDRGPAHHRHVPRLPVATSPR